jgi:hypothetical protein
MCAELRDIWGFAKDDIMKTTEEALGLSIRSRTELQDTGW